MPTDKREVIRSAGFYSLASALTQGITLLAGILTRRFLGPVQMGVWSLLQIILIYSSYTPLGVTEAISREIPFHQGKGDHAKAEEVKNLIFSFSMLTATLMAAGVLAYAFFAQSRLQPEIFHGLVFVSALVILQRISNLEIAFLRGYKQFSLASSQMILSSLVNAMLVAVLSWRYKIYGFMWAMAASFLFNILYIVARHRFHFRWKLDLGKTGELVRYGFPLMVVGLFSTIFLTIDKLMIARMLGLKELGLYSVAILAYSYIGNLPNAIGIVLVPNFHQKFGESQNVEDLKGYLEKSSLVFSDIMPLLIGTAWILVPYLARFVLPDYLGSIEPMRALILSGYFLALLQPYSYFLAVIRKQAILVPIVLIACLLAFAANWIAIRRGYGIVGVGVATTVVLFIKFTATYFIACRHLFTPKETRRNFAIALGKFVFMTGVLVGLWRLWPRADESLLLTLLELVVLAVLYLPFFWKLEKDLGVLASLMKKFQKRMAPEEELS